MKDKPLLKPLKRKNKKKYSKKYIQNKNKKKYSKKYIQNKNKKKYSKKYIQNKNKKKYSKKNKYYLKGGYLRDEIEKKFKEIFTSATFHTPILPVDLEIYGTLAFVVICQENDYNKICKTIEDIAYINDLSFKKQNSSESGKQYVWFFSGTQYTFERSSDSYSISVEFNKDFNLEEARKNYLQDIFKIERRKKFYYKSLNIYGVLVFGCLYKYTNSYIIPENFFTSIYDNGNFKVNENDFILFLEKTNEIFQNCHLLYSSISSNLLKEMFKIINPPVYEEIPNENQVRMGYYNQIETELNSTCLESSTANNTNIRMLLNMIILIINQNLHENHSGCAKSGGEVFRYYGEQTPFTNDIDTKVFYSQKLLYKTIYNIEKDILRLLICLTILIDTNGNIYNWAASVNPKILELGNLRFKISFYPYLEMFDDNDFDIRVRSKLISGFRLFSLDAFIGSTFEIIEKTTHNNLTLQTYFTASPLDIANYAPYPLSYYDNEKSLKQTVDMSSEYVNAHHFIILTETPKGEKPTPEMPIMSKTYLLKDILFLLRRPERQNKRDKDIIRFMFLLNRTKDDAEMIYDHIKTHIIPVDEQEEIPLEAVLDYLNEQGITIDNILVDDHIKLNWGSDEYETLNEFIHTIYNAKKDYIEKQLKHFEETISFKETDDGIIISNLDYKTPLKTGDNYDIMDYEP